AVAGEIIGAEVTEERRAPGAGVVTCAGALDLDHVGPEVAEDLPAQRAGEDARGVEDAHVGERSVGVGGHGGFSVATSGLACPPTSEAACGYGALRQLL